MAEYRPSSPSGDAGLSHNAAEPQRPPRFPAFNGLRAIAAMLVLGVHTAFVSGVTTRDGFGVYTARLEIGVSVFFLISGFLLYRPFVSAHLAGVTKPQTGAFWVRRLLRIVPAYWVALFLITTVFHLSTMGPGGWSAYVDHYFFLQIYFWSQWTHGITQAWSLCVEMTFYLFIPLYAMAIGWRREARSANQRLIVELIGLALMIGLSFAWRWYWLGRISPTAQTARLAATFWFPAFLDLFAFGMFLAVLSAWTHQHHSEPTWVTRAWVPWVSWGLAGIFLYSVGHLGISLLPVYTQGFSDITKQSLYGLFALFLLLPAVFGPQNKGFIRGFLRSWPVASLGAISYAIYLWHQAMIQELLQRQHLTLFAIPFWPFFFAVVGLSAAIAAVSYFVVERPALHLKNSLSWWRQRSSIGLINTSADPHDPSA